MKGNDSLKWKSHLCMEHPRKTVFLIIFLLAIWVGVYLTSGPFWLFIAILFLGGAVLPFFLPTYYHLHNDGIEVKGAVMKKKKSWADFRSCYPGKNGVLLSPFAKPSRLENFRGTYLRFNNNKDEVTEFITAHIKK